MILTYKLQAIVYLNDMQPLVETLKEDNITLTEEPTGDRTQLVITSKNNINPNIILKIGAFIGFLEHRALNSLSKFSLKKV